jgi:hypothetical protein
MKYQFLSDGVIRATIGDASDPTEQIAKKVGTIANIFGISTVQSLIPRSRQHASPSSYSGIYGKNSFPLHTDMAHWSVPPHYLMLRCIEPDKSVKTTILSKANLTIH